MIHLGSFLLPALFILLSRENSTPCTEPIKNNSPFLRVFASLREPSLFFSPSTFLLSPLPTLSPLRLTFLHSSFLIFHSELNPFAPIRG